MRPDLIRRAVSLARESGAAIVVGHGETIAEPVAAGTNRALIEAGVEVLAPIQGLIDKADATLAANGAAWPSKSQRRGPQSR